VSANPHDPEYEPGNEAAELVAWLGERVTDDRAEIALVLGRAYVLATLQVARELKRERHAIVELARVVIDELGSSPRA
jgi:hypothetical protein